MTNADRLIQWNQWFDQVPEAWKSQIVLWPLIAVGFLNMQLTIADGFPFGLLILLAILAMAAVRLPYLRGWIKTGDGPARLEIGRFDWLYETNRRFDQLPEWTRFWSVPAVLIVAGVLNIWLMASRGWSFGSLFLLVILAMIVLRAPYAWRLITPPPADSDSALLRFWTDAANRWYDSKTPGDQFTILLVGLAIAFVIDLWLAAGSGLALFVLFAAELGGLALLRMPHVNATLRVPALASPQHSAAPLNLPSQDQHIGQQNIAMLLTPAEPPAPHAEPLAVPPPHAEPVVMAPALQAAPATEPAREPIREPISEPSAPAEPAAPPIVHDAPAAHGGDGPIP